MAHTLLTPSSREGASARAGGLSPVRARAVVIGLLGAAAACFVVSWAELVVTSIQIAICQFAPAAIGLLFVLVLLNTAVKALTRRVALRPAEITIVYLMILTAALTNSRGLLERWIPTLVAVNYYTTEANHWEKTFYPNIPQWAVPFDVKGAAQQRVAVDFYEGLPAYRGVPWGMWLKPLASWLIIIVAFFLAYACLAAILRRQWVDHEKLSFPLVQLPVELAQDQTAVGAFFRNRLTWIGFAIPAFIFTLNGLHGLYPAVPQIPLQFALNQYFKAKPWTDMGYTTVYSSLAAVGFSYFLPAQVLMSLWSFYVLLRIENIIFSAFGQSFQAMPMYPTSIWNGYHVLGAYIVLSLYLVKSAMPHLRQVWARARSPQEGAEGREFMSDRAAVFGLALAVVVAILWFNALGMSLWMAVLETVVFLFLVVLVMARSVSEAGMLMTETSFRPIDLVRVFSSQQVLGPKSITALAMVDAVFTRDLRGNLLSTFLDGLKMADLTHLDRRHLLWSIAAALGVALVLGSTIQLILPYTKGAVTLYSYSYRWNSFAGFNYFQPILDSGDKYDPKLLIYFLSGLGFTVFLAYMRTQHAWWPFSPLGFALSGSWSMIVFWWPIFIAWLVKSIILRYGGMKVYLNLRPFFLGLILGEFMLAVIWAAIASIWRVPAPFFPWP
jgi:hypothetical protein